MKRTHSPRSDSPERRILQAPAGEHRPNGPPVRPAAEERAPVMRTIDAADFLANLPSDLRSLIHQRLESRWDRLALASSARHHYADGYPQRHLDFFLSHCHQISQLPDDEIAGFAASPLSQPLLNAVPGAATLVMLLKLSRLHDNNPQAASEFLRQLDQTDSPTLRTAFRLFQHWTEQYSPAAGDTMPFISADFLGAAPLLARVAQLSDDDGSAMTAAALTDALLTWTDYQGHQHLQMTSERQPLPPVWRALGELIRHLVHHGTTHPADPDISPERLLRLAGWCHFVQESGLLLANGQYSSEFDTFAALKAHQCIPALLDKLGPDDPRWCELADKLLQWQASSMSRYPCSLPHMASLRLFGVLLHGISPAIDKGTPQSVRLLNQAITALTNEFTQFAHQVNDRGLPAPGFPRPGESYQEPDSSEDSELIDQDIEGWTHAGNLLADYGEQTILLTPDVELAHKLLGLAHDLVSDLDGLSPAQICQLRLIDSKVASFQQLCLLVAELPAHQQHAPAASLRAVASLWPLPAYQDELASWVPNPDQ